MDALAVAWELRYHILFVFGVLLLTLNTEAVTINVQDDEE